MKRKNLILPIIASAGPTILLGSSLTSCNKTGFNYTESEKRIVFSCTNNTNTATTGIEAQYQENGITIKLQVEDTDIYAQNIYDIDYDDNVEILISKKTDEIQYTPFETFHFLVNGAGKFKFQTAKNATEFGENLDPRMHIILGENLIVDFNLANESSYGFKGYVTNVFFGYDIFGLTKETALGNMTIAASMRNSHDYSIDTAVKRYEKRGCSWINPNCFIVVDKDNNFVG